MDYLKKYDFNDSDIKDIILNNYESVLDNLIVNQEKVEAIIDYLIGIGIETSTIKEIFMYQIDLFMKSLEQIKVSFDEYELDSVVKSLNYDADNVELIEFI